MTSIDTNVIVRILARDDLSQLPVAQEIISQPGTFVPVTVLLEVGWVVESAYEMPREKVYEGLSRFLGMKEIYVREPFLVRKALEWYRDGMDFADAFHLALSQDADELITFDRQFAAAASGKGSCTVTQAG